MEKEIELPKRKKVKIDTHQPFGAVLRQLMTRDRWTCDALGQEVGCTRNHISEIASGHCFPSFSLAQKIASVFEYELAWRKIPAVPKGKRKKKEIALVEPQVESSSDKNEDQEGV